jgi:hypothetical protein
MRPRRQIPAIRTCSHLTPSKLLPRPSPLLCSESVPVWSSPPPSSDPANSAIVKVGFFTVLTICAAAVLLRSDAITANALARGLILQLPAAGLVTAIAVFGMTGVGATTLAAAATGATDFSSRFR